MSRIIGLDLAQNGTWAVMKEKGEPAFIFETNENSICRSPILIIKDRNVQVGEDGKKWSPEEQLALYFLDQKKHAEKRIGECVSEAVVSVPVHFSYSQCQAVQDAAKIAGLNIRLIQDPVAVALSLYKEANKNCAIFCAVVKDGFFDVVPRFKILSDRKAAAI